MWRYILAMASAALLLAGCGGNEARQRKAFIAFLQTRVIDKPGVHVPQLTADERASFGPYADQYSIITDFNRTMDKSVSPKLSAAMQTGSIQSLQDLVTQRTQLRAAKSSIDAMAASLGSDLARADTARAKLNQPADVKTVYDKAYHRLVSEPAAAFKSIVPVMDKVLGQAVDLGNYIDQHHDAVRISGSTLAVTDPAIQSTINDKLQTLQSSQQAVQSAQTRMQSVVYGTPS